MYTSIYTTNTPTMLNQLAATPEMRRLTDVGMHCGCEYAKIPIYSNSRFRYTRLIHSIGAANIIWHFTKDIKQAIAGLLHDIATPVFAHTIDFMNNDHVKQESTEARTYAIIENSVEIMSLLKSNNIDINDVCDYHKYPIADNDTPMLSADRLEYTLGDGYCIYHENLSQMAAIYNDLYVGTNEHGVAELCFNTQDIAKKFVKISLRNSRLYVSNEDRYLMQCLAEIIRDAINTGTLTLDDLYSTESEVTKSLKKCPQLSIKWNEYTNIVSISASKVKPPDVYSLKVAAKKRYINPLVKTQEGVKRIAEIDANLKMEIDNFLSSDFNNWLYAV